MAILWECKTTANSEYYRKIDYIPDPSLDLVEHFKDEIASYNYPSKHGNYVPCEHAEKSKGHLLFVLGNRIEVLVRPDHKSGSLYFVDCNDI